MRSSTVSDARGCRAARQRRELDDSESVWDAEIARDSEAPGCAYTERRVDAQLLFVEVFMYL